MANALTYAIVALVFMRKEGSVKHFIQQMMAGETVNLVGSWSIVDVSCHLINIFCWILVG